MDTAAPVTPEKKLRQPLTALLLNLLVPGLGYLYVGAPIAAFLLAAVYQLVPPIVVIIWSYARFAPGPLFWMMALLGPLEQRLPGLAILPIVAAIHAAYLAKKLGTVELRRWQRPLGYGTFFLVFGMTGYLLTDWVQSNFARRVGDGMPTNALAPTVKQGDMVWILKTKESRFPQRGSFALFAPTEAFRPPLFVRVVGMPSDTVSVQDGGVFINGEWKFDAQDGGTLAPTQLSEGQYFGIADGRDPAQQAVDSRDVGPLKAGDYLGSIGVIVFERPDPGSRP
ncbi:MAG: S26 family signal peptidase, partial [Myxococcaceae bacterium]